MDRPSRRLQVQRRKRRAGLRLRGLVHRQRAYSRALALCLRLAPSLLTRRRFATAGFMLRIKPLRLAGGYRVACWTHRNGKVFDHSPYIPQLAGSQGSQAEVWLRFASDYLIDDVAHQREPGLGVLQLRRGCSKITQTRTQIDDQAFYLCCRLVRDGQQ